MTISRRELYAAGEFSEETIADDSNISVEALKELARRQGVTYGSAKVKAKVADTSNTTGKLTPSDVRQIRRLLDKGDSLADIGRAYGVHPRSIARIRDGEAWSNI